MADDLTARILADYPSFAFLLHDPEIGPLLLDAVDPNKGFDAATFQAKLMQTNWWKTSNASQRQWETLIATDPAEAQQKRDERSAQIRQIVGQSGLYFDEQQLAGAVDMSLQLGVDPSSSTFRSWLGTWASQNPGSTANVTPNLKAIAEHDYLVPIDDGTLNWWASQIASGTQTEANFRATYARVAAGRFPQITDMIDKGITPGQFFAPYQAAIANTLELGSADQVDLLNDPRWSQVTGITGADNKIRPMTLSEAMTFARKQPEWQQTSGARQQGADLTDQLLKTFGRVA